MYSALHNNPTPSRHISEHYSVHKKNLKNGSSSELVTSECVHAGSAQTSYVMLITSGGQNLQSKVKKMMPKN